MHHGWRSVPLGISLGSDPESRQRILAAGIPYVSGASAREEVCELLATAARAEHAMMVEYLRSAFSAQDPAIAQTLSEIAGDELQHLLTLQNLRLMLGAEPKLDRQVYGSPPTAEPFPLLKDEFSLDSLAQYVCCEAPPFNQVREHQRVTFGKARRSWSITAPFVNRMGALYAKIYWLFMKDDQEDDAWPDFPIDLLARDDAGRHVPDVPLTRLGRQIASTDWPGVMACISNQGARCAVLEIAGRGEGGPAQAESHFDRLLDAYALAEHAGAVRCDQPRTVPVEPTLDALYNSWASEILLALTLDPQEPTQREVRRALLATAFEDWNCLTNLARGELRAAPRFELVSPTSGDRSQLYDGLDAATQTLVRSLDLLLGGDATLRVSSWASDLRRRLDAKRALTVQLRAMR